MGSSLTGKYYSIGILYTMLYNYILRLEGKEEWGVMGNQ
jgi:hypothetical protein